MKKYFFQKAGSIAVAACIFFLQGCTTLEFNKHESSYEPPLPQISDVKIALVLGGGGVKGFAHVGVIEELSKGGIHPDLIVGCSAGSIVGGLYANTGDIEKARDILLSANADDFVEFSLADLPFSLFDISSFDEFLDRNLKAKNFDQLKIPFVAVATNLEFGNLTVFGTGPVKPAILASAAYPGAILPVKIHDQYFVDGGLINPVPVSIARLFKPKFVIAIELVSDLESSFPESLFGIVERSLEISYDHLSSVTATKADFLIRVPFGNIGTFDVKDNIYAYKKGREAGRAALPELKRILEKANLIRYRA